MVVAGSSCFSDLGQVRFAASRAQPGTVVVHLSGEHDIATDSAVRLTLARAIALGNATVVVDLSEVAFMGASTVGVMLAARESLRLQSRSLMVQAPSAIAQRVIALFSLADFVVPSATGPAGLGGQALSSWVGVPAAERTGADADVSPTVRPEVAEKAVARGGP